MTSTNREHFEHLRVTSLLPGDTAGSWPSRFEIQYLILRGDDVEIGVHLLSGDAAPTTFTVPSSTLVTDVVRPSTILR